jgi:hypothetical protein
MTEKKESKYYFLQKMQEKEMQNLQADNQRILQEARMERD